jgi:multiple sugar transport system permease protein
MKSSVSRRYRLTLQGREEILGWGFILPALTIILALILYPVIYNIYLSLFRVNLGRSNSWVGFGNYAQILAEAEFWHSVVTTVVYVVFTSIGATVGGLIVALAMSRKFPLRAIVRGIILLPYVAPIISVVFAWQFFFDPVNGIFMHVVYGQLHLIPERINLIDSPANAVWIAILFSIWRDFPFAYLMILARLQAIDLTLYEAAEIDGCSAWQKFLAITLPELFFVLGTLILLRVIWNFNTFEQVYLLTQNVKVLSVYTYFKAFLGTADLGQGATVAVVQFLILLVFILFYLRRVLKW